MNLPDRTDERQRQVGGQPGHLLARDDVGEQREARPEHQEPLEAVAAAQPKDGNDEGAGGERQVERLASYTWAPQSGIDAPGGEAGGGQYQERPGEEAKAASEHVEQGRGDAEEEGEELVDRQQGEVVVPGLTAALDFLLGKPVAEGLPDASSETEHVGQKGGVEQEKDAVEQSPG